MKFFALGFATASLGHLLIHLHLIPKCQQFGLFTLLPVQPPISVNTLVAQVLGILPLTSGIWMKFCTPGLSMPQVKLLQAFAEEPVNERDTISLCLSSLHPSAHLTSPSSSSFFSISAFQIKNEKNCFFSFCLFY